MIRSIAILSLSALLAACGVDGEPETPQPQPKPQTTQSAPKTGVSISGSVRAGVKTGP